MYRRLAEKYGWTDAEIDATPVARLGDYLRDEDELEPGWTTDYDAAMRDFNAKRQMR